MAFILALVSCWFSMTCYKVQVGQLYRFTFSKQYTQIRVVKPSPHSLLHTHICYAKHNRNKSLCFFSPKPEWFAYISGCLASKYIFCSAILLSLIPSAAVYGRRGQFVLNNDTASTEAALNVFKRIQIGTSGRQERSDRINYSLAPQQ